MRLRIFVALVGMIWLSACVTTTESGDGCAAYGEARASMPVETAALPNDWLRWIAAADTRMTAVCR